MPGPYLFARSLRRLASCLPLGRLLLRPGLSDSRSVEFAPEDFQPLEGFDRARRWTQGTRRALPPEVLADIHPLSEAKADELRAFAESLHRRFALMNAVTEAEVVGRQTVFTHAARADYGPVRDWLQAMSPDGGSDVVVFWHPPGCGVVTLWQIFCDHWDDFCFPGSDDVVVWPLAGPWAARYQHSEDFGFAKAVPLLPA